MGTNIFGVYGVDLGREINKYLGPAVLPATLIKVTPGTRTPGQLTGGTNPTTTSYACRGFIDMQGARTRQDSLASRSQAGSGLTLGGTKVAVLIGDSIANGTVVPEPLDKIVLEGVTYIIPEGGKVDRDPAAATYTCEIATL